MRKRLLIRALVVILAVGSMAEAQNVGKAPSKKKVLVELYTSQGCDSCPAASDLLGKLAEIGYGPDRVVAVGFHVDYFNDPWADPFSDPAFGRRQLSYNEVQGRKDLYFTPLLMVDGVAPMLGSDRPKVTATLDRALKDKPAVDLKMTVVPSDPGKTLTVEVWARSAEVAGRDLLVGVAVTEDPVTTRVLSGENAGKTLVEHAVVRSFAYRMIRVDRSGSKTATFPLALAAGQLPGRSRVAVFVQDRLTGKVHQADAAAWEPKDGPDSDRPRNAP